MRNQPGTLQTPDGFKLFTQQWLPDTPPTATLVIAHGYAEHSGRYAETAAYFVQQGYAVYALDHRGHGQSRGDGLGYFARFELLSDDLGSVVEQARSQGGPLFLIGHSMGGLLALHYVIRQQPRLNGLVTSGALLDVGEGTPATQQSVGRVLSRLLPRLRVAPTDLTTVSKDQAVVRAYQNDPNVYHGNVAARVGIELIDAVAFVRANLNEVTLPILCLHGAMDKIVNPRCTQLIYDKVSSTDKTIKIYDGLFHEIFNEPEKARVLADVWVWLAEHQAPAS